MQAAFARGRAMKEQQPDEPIGNLQPLGLENPHLPIWSSMLDNRFLCEVQRIDADYGTFVIFDVHDGNKPVFNRKVPLMYGAPFGPDVDDVARWEEMGIQFVDTGKVEP